MIVFIGFSVIFKEKLHKFQEIWCFDN